MKIRTVRRGIIILCLMCILAAFARGSAAAEASHTSDTAAACASPAPAGQAWFENSSECLRIISDCLGHNKSPLPPDETLSPDGGTSFTG